MQKPLKNYCYYYDKCVVIALDSMLISLYVNILNCAYQIFYGCDYEITISRSEAYISLCLLQPRSYR